ncbi:bactofilin family protein [Rhizobacter sp. LjRoot28]|uniref:bactofilin family protein n=1 Tax=Rhizobacter sp. LjRoot28 TaxID=3342309 RepID=UPI003ED03F1E
MRALPVLRTEVPVPAPAHAPAGGAFREPLDSDVTAQWLHLPRPAQGLFVVPVGTRIAGDCRARHVWVRGEVTGRVTATEGLLVVDLGARVLGGVEGSGSVVIAGSVAAGHAEHAVIARGRLDLACTAIIHGSVQHGLVTIYEGAAVDGEFVGLEK